MRRRKAAPTDTPPRSHRYRQLRHPFPPQSVLSADAVANIHATALRVLEELGVKILLPEARQLFASAGARVVEDMVYIGADIVEAGLAAAPREITIRGRRTAFDQHLTGTTMTFLAGAGCPNATDLVQGRRPGTLADYTAALRLQQSFDAIHLHGPSVEPQDIPAHLRHYWLMQRQLVTGEKPYFLYARGRQQIAESLEMVSLALGEADLACRLTTVINTNSPRQIDVPMAEGLIDFARAGQLTIVTPFCLAGAMAPVTVEGALVLQHAEALAAIALNQLARPGAPVLYGGFSSNVDMKSGAPAFGTPEHIKLTIGSGQLARHIGLPWRSAAGAASNAADMQAAGETHMALWAALMANATLTVHAAGWLEGGLTFGFEKFINDMEAVQTLAELCTPLEETEDALGFDALAEVAPGGHFFDTTQTMARYREAFYPPLVADLSNFGTWSDAGSKTSTQRATAIWQSVVDDFVPPDGAGDIAERLAPWIEAHEAAGGAPPVS